MTGFRPVQAVAIGPEKAVIGHGRSEPDAGRRYKQ
jgi:hypothetical protein